MTPQIMTATEALERLKNQLTPETCLEAVECLERAVRWLERQEGWRGSIRQQIEMDRQIRDLQTEAARLKLELLEARRER